MGACGLLLAVPFNLGEVPAVAPGDPGQLGAGERRAVGGQQGEALVDQPVGGAELPDAAVPAPGAVAAVLDEVRPDARAPAQELELFEGDVADAEQAGPAAAVDGFHGPPGPAVGRAP